MSREAVPMRAISESGVERAASPRALLSGAVLLGALTLLAVVLALAGSAAAAVLSIEIEKRIPVLGGKKFGDSGAYEMIEGQVRFGFDPQSEANARVTDIRLAPRNAEGLVEASANFVVLQAVDPEKRRGIGLFDVPNRGRRLGLAAMNRSAMDIATGTTLDPQNPSDWGDGFLMEEGLTVLWVGWQSDAPEFPGSLRLRVPVARQADGSRIRGLARSDWVVDAPAKSLPLAVDGHTPIPAADPSSTQKIGRAHV